MRRVRSTSLALVAVAGIATAQPGREPGPSGPFGFGALGNRKDPITVVANNLEYDYKRNVVVYRGQVEVNQGDVKLVSDALTITLDDAKRDGAAPAAETGGTPAAGGPDTGRVREIVASGNVRIDQGPRWAVGGRAVFDQVQRTLVLTENPVLHDGPNEIAGDRVVVYLDQDRSVVEGGQKRVKAVLYPDQQKPGARAPGAKPAAPGPGAPPPR